MQLPISQGSTRLQLVLFRFAFCYFSLFLIFFQGQVFIVIFFPFLEFLDDFFITIYNNSIGWVGSVFLHKELGKFRNGGDNLFNNVAVVTFLISSLIIAIIWTIADKSKNHRKLLRAFYVVLRYFLAYMMFTYGLAKIFGIQFRYPAPGDLLRPLGDHSPFTLLWRFMGYSKTYSIITGSFEVLGGILLLFRKTTTLGAIISFGALCNVFILNVSYGINVKLFSLHLLVIAFVLMSEDLKQFYNFLILHKPASITVMQPVFDWQKKLVPKILKTLFLGYLAYNVLSSPIKFLPELEAMKSSFYGAYNVEEFIINRASLPPLTTDSVRWKKMIVDNKWGITVQYMNDSTKWFSGTIDTVTKSVELKDFQDTTFKSKLFYTMSQPHKYLFEGTWRNDSIAVRLQKIDLNQFRLVNTKRSWIVN